VSSIPVIGPRTALITGCSSGFGSLTARTLAAAGHHVFAGMRDVSGRNAGHARQLQDWAASLGLRLDVVDIDVTSSPSVESAVKGVLDRTERVDVLVNNAGRGAVGPLEAFTESQVEALFDLNVFGPMRVNRAVLPSMRRQRSGLIVHVSSTIGRVLPGVGGLYAATKWALEGLAESLRYEVHAFGIEAAILEPGAFPSPAMSKAMAAAREDIAREYAAASARVDPPMDQVPTDDYRLPDPQDVAAAVKHLIDLPAGERPLRTVVGPIFTEGVVEYNAAYELASRRLAEALRRPDQAITWGRRAAEPIPSAPASPPPPSVGSGTQRRTP
jgi:NAD(P)-dependent dehydrogenase (short-subunit alcohol dehydrogenase family)